MDVLDWRRADRPGALLRMARNALNGGAVVAFPTVGGYVAAVNAHDATALQRLATLADRPIGPIVSGLSAALDWAPGLGGVGRRLARRAWPGPLVVATREGVEAGLANCLATTSRALLIDGGLELRCADHEALRAVLDRVGWPVVGVPVALDRLGIDVLIADGGRNGPGETTVTVSGDTWTISRPGAIDEAGVRRWLARMIVFVCTGNTCRSPLAEALCRKRLAERLNCTTAELPARGWEVRSAGLAAAPGMPAADEAVAVAQAMGADLSRHESRPLDEEGVMEADYLLAMTGGHLRALRSVGPPGDCRLISPEGQDVADPIGGPREVYEACARELDACIERFVAEVTGVAGET